MLPPGPQRHARKSVPPYLLDEAGLRFQRLPHIGIERAFCDVAENAYLRVQIALTQDAPLALFNVARAPWRVEMMQRHETTLHIGASTHLLGRADENAHPSCIHRIEKPHLRAVSIGIVNEGDLLWRDAADPAAALAVHRRR